nr:hypothetical protein [Tanacetum cinerariifolium]
MIRFALRLSPIGREGDIHFLEELLIDDSILSHESFDSNFKDNPSISRPPPEQPDDNFDLEPEVISAIMEDIDEPNEHFNPRGEIFVSTNIEDIDNFLSCFSFEFSFHISSFLRFLHYYSPPRVKTRSLILVSPNKSSYFRIALPKDKLIQGSSRANDSDYPPKIEDFLCRILSWFSRPSIIPRWLKISCVGYCPGFQDLRLEECAMWDGGNSTWGGRGVAFGTVPLCVRVQEMAGGEGRVLVGMVVKGALFRQLGFRGLAFLVLGVCLSLQFRFRLLGFGIMAEMVLIV